MVMLISTTYIRLVLSFSYHVTENDVRGPLPVCAYFAFLPYFRSLYSQAFSSSVSPIYVALGFASSFNSF